MSTLLPSWLAGMSGFEGLHAAGIAVPGGEPELRCWNVALPADELPALWRQATDVAEVLQSAQLPSQKLRWMFERRVVYFEQRRDGAALLLLTSHEPWLDEGEAVTQVIGQFRELNG